MLFGNAHFYLKWLLIDDTKKKKWRGQRINWNLFYDEEKNKRKVEIFYNKQTYCENLEFDQLDEVKRTLFTFTFISKFAWLFSFVHYISVERSSPNRSGRLHACFLLSQTRKLLTQFPPFAEKSTPRKRFDLVCLKFSTSLLTQSPGCSAVDDHLCLDQPRAGIAVVRGGVFARNRA